MENNIIKAKQLKLYHCDPKKTKQKNRDKGNCSFVEEVFGLDKKETYEYSEEIEAESKRS